MRDWVLPTVIYNFEVVSLCVYYIKARHESLSSPSGLVVCILYIYSRECIARLAFCATWIIHTPRGGGGWTKTTNNDGPTRDSLLLRLIYSNSLYIYSVYHDKFLLSLCVRIIHMCFALLWPHTTSRFSIKAPCIIIIIFSIIIASMNRALINDNERILNRIQVTISREWRIT